MTTMKKKKNRSRKPRRRARHLRRASGSKAGKPTAAPKKPASQIDLPRLRALFSLRKLSNPPQSDVMSDGSITGRYNIPTHRPAHLGAKISLDQAPLLAAFRTLLSG